MKKKICFIINPASGVGKQKVVEKHIELFLDKTIYDYNIEYTNGPKHAITLAKTAAENKYDIVVAVGGDGSVNEVAKGLVGTNSAMAILPAGSGNGLARHSLIPLNFEKAIKKINTGNERMMDTIHFNEELFVNIAGVGFDALIGWEFAKFGKRGLTSYVKVIIREFRKYKPQEFELMIEGKSQTKKAFLISFANGHQWGNNACIAPLAHVSDGVMDIAILKPFKLWNIFSIGYKLFNNTLNTSSFLEIIKTPEVRVKQSGKIAHIDGEPIESGNEISIKVNPLSLKIIT